MTGDVHVPPTTARGRGRVRPGTGGTAALAVAIVGAATAWRATVLGRGWFARNDFLLMAPDAPVTGTTGPAGFSPASVVLARTISDLAPLSWPVGAGAVLVLSAVTLLLAWSLLSLVLPGRWVRLPLLAFLATTPLTLWATQWWTFALQFWPGALGFLVAAHAVTTLVLRLDRRALPRVVLAGLGLALALLSDERWLLAPLLLLGLALAVSPGARTGARLRSTRTRSALLAAVLAVVTAAYLSLRALVVPVAPGPGESTGGLVTSSLRHVAALLPGGPWGSGLVGHASLTPPDLAVGAGVLLLLPLVALTVRRGGPGTRVAWLALGVVLVGTAALPALLRDGDLSSAPDLVHRFGAVAAVAVTVLVAAALREVPPVTARLSLGRRGAHETDRRVGEGVPAGIVALALVASAAVSTPALASPVLHGDVRRYVEQARAGLRADPAVVLLDSGVPDAVMSPSFGSAAVVSTVLARADEAPVFDLPSHDLRAVSPTGALVPVPLFLPVAMEAGANPACPWPVRSAGVTVPLRTAAPAGRLVARIGYYTSAAGIVTLDAAGRRVEVPVRSGLGTTDVVLGGPVDRVILRLEDESGDATVCVASLQVGTPAVRTP